jgi:hypothetical protein
MQDDLSDRRRSPRIPCDLSVEYEERGARTQQGRIANIGITGTLLKKWSAGVEFVHLNFQEQDEIWRYYARELARQRKPDAWRRPKLGSE